LDDHPRTMRRIAQRSAVGQEAPIWITPRDVARLIRQIVGAIRGDRRRRAPDRSDR
jgi:hypothetical protein